MWIFAIVVYALHSLAELAFGTRAFLSGSFSSQSREEVSSQPPHLAGSARFLGAALIALGFLGAVVLLGPGVGSATGKMIAAVLALFHIVGVAGVLATGHLSPGYLAQTHARGAMIVHLVLGLGFLIVTLGHGAIGVPAGV